MADRNRLAETAEAEARKFYHGFVMETEPTIGEIIAPFPKWTLEEADGNWCAAFVYRCCVLAGFGLPIRPKECVSSNLAGCAAWEEWAKEDPRIGYHPAGEDYTPRRGDVVLFDRVFCGVEHDHIGVVLTVSPNHITVAEGNINNLSGVIRRRRDEHIRAYINIPDGFLYE